MITNLDLKDENINSIFQPKKPFFSSTHEPFLKINHILEEHRFQKAEMAQK